MRRISAVILALAALALGLAPAATGVPVSGVGDVPRDACQPDPTVNARQTLTCRYGPVLVTPGTNMILLGPVTVESPRADGYIVSMRPDMVLATTGEIPPIHELHLHHGVWLNPARNGTTPFMAAGEEKTVSAMPSGYGYRTAPHDQWILNYMIHNQTAATDTVFITYELEFVPLSSPEGATLKPVDPLWFDVVGGFYPVYDPQRTGEIDAATGRPIHGESASFSSSLNYEMVWMAGHVHPGGLRDEVRVASCGDTPIFNSEAVLNTRPGVTEDQSFGSWDYLMTATPPDWRFVLKRGDRLSLRAVYDTTHPWYEAMGIVFGWGRRLTDAEAAAMTAARPNPCATTPGVVTREMPVQMPVFGGDGDPLWDPTALPASGPPVTEIDIAGFTYQPGNVGEPPAVVKAGQPVVFRNVDAAAGIYHTVTECDGPCNLSTGQSYPKAAWGFESRQLGYGPPEITPAAQRSTWTFTPPASLANQVISYYCRVHPPMRGSLKVIP